MRKRIRVTYRVSFSVQNGEYDYCTPGKTVELAIFEDDEWYTKELPIKSLEAKADCGPGECGTRVFGHVNAEELFEVAKYFSNRGGQLEI